MTDSLTIAIAGNPNCGKSALFNTLTGIHQKTGNWPGVTVERKEGNFRIGETRVRLVDLPGIYSLDASSLDEQVTQEYLLSSNHDLIINIIDASNLERNLYLTVQLLEMGKPVIVALNMMDVARKRGVTIDSDKLADSMGCPVLEVVAITGEGINRLKQSITDVQTGQRTAGYALAHDDIVEQAVSDLATGLPDSLSSGARHWIALKLLEGDNHLADQFDVDRKLLTHWQNNVERFSGEDTEIHIADSRYNHAHTLARSCTHHRGRAGATTTDRIDTLVLNRFFGVPFFLLVMYLMFMFTINLGGAFIDFFDLLGEAVFVDGIASLLESAGAPAWMHVLLASGVGGGLQIVATFIPIIASLYLFLSFVEDSGYMARAAFVMDRFMRSIGLPGKAFVPLIVGFGCNVPAVMATRTLENERERKLTILMNPFMSCGARLPVYALFAAAFFPHNGQNLVFLLYIIGIAVAILTGLIMNRSLLGGQSSGFMIELPSYHMPTARGIALHTWDRVKHFLGDAGGTIVLMVVVLNVLNSIGPDGSLGNEDTDNSILAIASQNLTPVFTPMGIEEDNWPAVLGIVSGVLAKEVVVSTLDTIYSKLDQQQGYAIDTEIALGFADKLAAAAATVPENLGLLGDLIIDPLALDVGNVSDLQAAAESQEVSTSTFGAMTTRFNGQAAAFAYLLFILLYFPCVATLAAVKRETGFTWAVFVALWTTGIAYAVASGFYQIATWQDHATFTISWISGIAFSLMATVLVLRLWAGRGSHNTLVHGDA